MPDHTTTDRAAPMFSSGITHLGDTTAAWRMLGCELLI
jgi:hypothetical protein